MALILAQRLGRLVWQGLPGHKGGKAGIHGAQDNNANHDGPGNNGNTDNFFRFVFIGHTEQPRRCW